MSVLKIKSGNSWVPIETIRGEKGEQGDVDVNKLGLAVNPDDHMLYHYYDGNFVGIGIPWPYEYVEPDSISISDSSLSFFNLGGEQTLSAEILPLEATNHLVVWESTDEAVATVSATGVVTAVGPGSAYIIARNVENDLNASAAVTVENRGDVDILYSAYNLQNVIGRNTNVKPLQAGKPFSVQFTWRGPFNNLSAGIFQLYNANETVQAPISFGGGWINTIQARPYIAINGTRYCVFYPTYANLTMKGVLTWDGEKIRLRASMENYGYAPITTSGGKNGTITSVMEYTPSFTMTGDWDFIIGVNTGSNTYGTLEELVLYSGLLESDYITDYIDLGYDPTVDEISDLVGSVSSSGTIPPYTNVAYVPNAIPAIRNSSTTKTVVSSDPTVLEVPT